MITGIEEFDIMTKLQFPHLFIKGNELISQKRVSKEVLFKDNAEILFISSGEFDFSSILSGLTSNHIEYIAKNAPRDYKENILKLLRDQEMMKGVFEIAKAMDDDLGDGITKNQERVKNVIQYIKDNRAAFEF